MAQTVSNLSEVMKEVFTEDRLVKQFYDEQDWLNRVTKTSRWTEGRKAYVPIHKGRSGGYSVKPAAGGTLNSADEQKVDHAEYTIPYHYQQIQTEVAAYNEAAGGETAAVEALVLEIEGGVQDLRNQIERQFLGNGDALIAQCTTSNNSTTVLLSTSGYGFDAIERGWLYPGLPIDIGTTANEVAVADGVEIIDVVETESAPAITVAAAITTSSSHYISIKDARSGTTSYETNGLRTIAGSTSTSIGGLDPDTAGEAFWKPASVNATDTVLSLNAINSAASATHQKAGKKSSFHLTSLKQIQALYELLQNQVRFSADSVSAGNVETTKYNGNEVMAIPAVPGREWYVLNLDDLAIIHGKKITGPTWFSKIQGSNTGSIWSVGTTALVDSLVYPCNLGVRRRNSSASLTTLTA